MCVAHGVSTASALARNGGFFGGSQAECGSAQCVLLA
jgi:hypothetical protein